jgi:hypothetical protein
VSDYDADVIPFPRGQFEKRRNERESLLDERPVRAKRGSLRACHHDQSVVDEAARTVLCRACGVALDPVAVLARIAHNREGLVHRGMMLRAEAEHLQKRVDDLGRKEKNLKARLRRAEHPALKEARQTLVAAEKVLWEAHSKLAFDPTLSEKVMHVWSTCRRVADKLRPTNIAAGA